MVRNWLDGWTEPGSTKQSVLMVAGGLCYTVGTWFLKNDHRAWWVHSIWHILVILGSALHFLAIVMYVKPL